MRFRHDLAWIMAGQGVAALCQWGRVIVVARLAGAETVGQFALAMAIASPIMMLGGLQMRQVLVTDAIGRYSFESYRMVRLWGLGLAYLVIVGIACFPGHRDQAAIILSVGLLKVIESVRELNYGLHQRHRRLDLVAQSLILRAVTSLAVLVLVFYLTRDLALGVLAMAGVTALVWCFFDRVVSRQWRQEETGGAKPDPKQLIELAALGLPLGVTLLLGSLNVNVPRYVVAHLSGSEALGVFAVMAYFVTAGKVVITALCQPTSPRLADAFAKGNVEAFRRLLLKVVGLSALLGLAGVVVAGLAGKPLLTLVYGALFAERVDIFVWVMVAGMITYAATPLGYSLTAMRIFHVQPLVFAAVLAVNALACLLLVPGYGALGAVWGWVIAATFQLLLTGSMNWYGLRAARRVAILKTG
jgi:O-antigen/teichoic acid export membrane protein